MQIDLKRSLFAGSAIASMLLTISAIWPIDRSMQDGSQTPKTKAQADSTRWLSRPAFAVLKDRQASEAMRNDRLRREELQQIAENPNPVERSRMLEQWASNVRDVELPVVLDEVIQNDYCGAGTELRSILIRRWADYDIRASVSWVERLPASSVRQEALSAVAIEWANQAPSEAAKWAKQLPDESERSRAVLDIAYEFIRTEPIEALRFAMELPPNVSRDELLHHAAKEWASQDGQSASRWVRQIQDETLRQQLIAGVAAGWGDRDPVSAATLVVTEMLPDRMQADAAVAIVQRWVQQQPDQAAAWVESFPSGELKLAATENMASILSNQAPLRAKQ